MNEKGYDSELYDTCVEGKDDVEEVESCFDENPEQELTEVIK